MKCANCGKKINPGTRFCQSCGIPLSDTEYSGSSGNYEDETIKGSMTYTGSYQEGTFAENTGFHDRTHVDFSYDQFQQRSSSVNSGYHYEHDSGSRGNQSNTDMGDHDVTQMDWSGPDLGWQNIHSVNGSEIHRTGREINEYTYFDTSSSMQRGSGAGTNPRDDYYGAINNNYIRTSETIGTYGPYDRVNTTFEDYSDKKFTKKNYKRIVLIALAIVMAFGCTAFGTVRHQQKVRDQERANRVVRMIDRLGDADAVTLADKTQVDTARKTFDELTDRQKEQVDNDTSLFSAESIIDQLEKEQEQNDLTEDDLNRQQEIFEQQQEDLNRQNEDYSEFEEEPYSYVMTHPVSWGAYRVTTESQPLTLRSGPGYGYTRLAKIPRDTIVYVYGAYNGWYYVDYNGRWGWSNEKYLTCAASEPLVPLSAESTAGYRMTELNPSYIGDYVVNTTKLHLRSGPGTGYASRAIMSKNEIVSAYGSYDRWLYIDYNGTWGWANGKTKYLKQVKTPSNATKTELPPECEEIVSDPIMEGEFKINANELNIRKGPGTDYSKMKTLHKGDKVNGYNVYNGWRYVEYKDQRGWMKDQYLEAVVRNSGSESEATQLIPPPEYKDLGEYRVSTKETDLPLRYGPDKKYSEICGMPKGSTVTAHGYLDGWYYVEYNGQEGWAGKDYLTKQPESGSEQTMVKPSHEDYIADYTTSSTTTLRYGPGTEYGEGGSLPQNADVSAYGTEKGWYYVYYKDKDITGWIPGNDLKKKEGTEASPQNDSEGGEAAEMQEGTDDDAMEESIE